MSSSWKFSCKCNGNHIEIWSCIAPMQYKTTGLQAYHILLWLSHLCFIFFRSKHNLKSEALQGRFLTISYLGGVNDACCSSEIGRISNGLLRFMACQQPKAPTYSINQSELARKAREIRQHRQVRQTRQLRQEQDKETKCKFKFALLDFPPYIMNQSINQGFMYQTLTWFVDMACFGREATDPIACKMVPVFVQNQDEMVKLIKNGSVDFGFPILSDAKQKLTGLDSVTLIRAFVSSGCSMIVNLKQCKAESREQLFTSITSQWPILAYIILLSGISGVIIWLLVRVKAYHRQSILSLWSSLVLILRKVRFKLNCYGFSIKIVQGGIDGSIFE